MENDHDLNINSQGEDPLFLFKLAKLDVETVDVEHLLFWMVLVGSLQPTVLGS